MDDFIFSPILKTIFYALVLVFIVNSFLSPALSRRLY